jgi:DNA mismatch repair protein MutL
VIEGSEVKEQSICSAAVGTSVMVKNLFYNVPARRNFLKTEQTETTYIVEELLRVALVHNDIAFSYYNNGKLVNRYPKSGLRQRINAIFSANYSEKLLPLEEKTHVVSFSGFVGKPEYVRKTRGEQYFFVNKRYIRHPYLAHSVEKAYTELIPEHTYPSYFIYLTMDPSLIDVNIHPTKTEIKFQDEKTIYGLLKAAIRKSFGSYGIVPSIDFEMERAYDFTEKTDDKPIRMPTISVNRDYNPFAGKEYRDSGTKPGTDKNTAQWEKLYNVEQNSDINNETENKLWDDDRNDFSGALFVMFSKRVFATQVKSGLMFVDVVNARERILFERYLANLQEHPCEGQRLLYPQSIEFSPADAELLTEIMADVKLLGIDVEPFGKNTFVVHSLPADMFEENAAGIIEKLLESYKMQQMELNSDKKTSLAAVVARNLSQKGLRILSPQEMQALVDELFACSIPEMAPSGRKTIFIMPYGEIEKKFR